MSNSLAFSTRTVSTQVLKSEHLYTAAVQASTAATTVQDSCPVFSIPMHFIMGVVTLKISTNVKSELKGHSAD